MSRPTNEPKTRVLKVRISEELAEKIGQDNVSGRVRKILEDSFVPQNNSFVPQNKSKAESFVPQNKSEEINDILKDTLTMIKLSVGEEEMIDFLNDFHDRLESGELQIVNGKLKLGYHEIFEVLNSSEVKGWLRPVWAACEEKCRPNTDGLRAIFKHGAKLAVDDLYGDRQ